MGTPTRCPFSAFPRALDQPTELLGAGVVATQNVTSATDLLCVLVKSAIRSQKCSLPTVLELAGELRGLERDPRAWAGLWGRELESGVGADQSLRGRWPRGPIAGNQDSARPRGWGEGGTLRIPQRRVPGTGGAAESLRAQAGLGIQGLPAGVAGAAVSRGPRDPPDRDRTQGRAGAERGLRGGLSRLSPGRGRALSWFALKLGLEVSRAGAFGRIQRTFIPLPAPARRRRPSLRAHLLPGRRSRQAPPKGDSPQDSGPRQWSNPRPAAWQEDRDRGVS